MNFITLSFAFFFLFVLGMSALFRKGTLTYKVFLLSFNLLFYAFAGLSFVPMLIFVGAMNWLSAKLSNGLPLRKKSVRKGIISLNVIIHVLLLSFYKYYEFFLLNVEAAFNTFGISVPLFSLIPTTDLLFPVGLSFYIFQGLSYSIDQYRNPSQKPESLFNVLLFVSFFPTILAGPILRGHDFFAQLKGITQTEKGKKTNGADSKSDIKTSDKSTVKADIAIGFSFILSGLFKKVVLASYLSEHIVRDVFLAPDFYSSFTLLIAIYAYAMQIYCDFSGYSDIAVGIGRLMGYTLPQNFNAPYLAYSLQDFWRRWHITLSLWLRDYLYIPLGGNKKGNKAFNLIVTMTLGGLWHGAHLRFLIWGFMHGVGLSAVYFWQLFLGLISLKKGFTQKATSGSSTAVPSASGTSANVSVHLSSDAEKKNGHSRGKRAKGKGAKGKAHQKDVPLNSQYDAVEKDKDKNGVENAMQENTATQDNSSNQNNSAHSLDSQNKKPLALNEKSSALLVLEPLGNKSESFIKRLFRKFRRFISWFVTFHFVCILWVFFRAEESETAFRMIIRLFSFDNSGDGFPALVLLAIVFTMLTQIIGPYLFRFVVSFLQKLWSPVQIVLIALACAIILKLGPDGVLPFIYFQF